jgi:hypothetical protein
LHTARQRRSFDVDAFLAGSSLHADRIWHQGDVIRKDVAEDSGFSVMVSSSADDLLGEQMEGAIEFLTAHREDFRQLAKDPTIEAGLDFARHRDDPFPIAEFDRFSRAMVL